MASLRIIYFSPAAFPERKSSSIQIINTCHALARGGARVTLYVKKLKGTPEEVLAHYGLAPHANLEIKRPGKSGSKLNAWSGRAFKFWLFRLTLKMTLRRLRGEQVCFYFRGASRVLEIIGWLAPHARRASIPLVYEVHSIQYEDEVHVRRYLARGVHEQLKMKRLMESWDAGNKGPAPEFTEAEMAPIRQQLFALEKNAYGALAGMITISDRLVELVREHFGITKPHLVAPSGVPLEVAVIPPRAGRDLDLVYVGNLFYFNGVTVLLEALALLPASIHLTIVGGGEPGDLDRCVKLSHDLKLGKRVEFLGFRPHPEAIATLRRSRVAVAPMLQGVLARVEDYCSPGKLGEYMASGAAIVASRIRSIQVFLREGENALLCDPNDAEALAEALARALEDEPLAARLAAQAFADVQPFTFESRARRLREFISQL